MNYCGRLTNWSAAQRDWEIGLYIKNGSLNEAFAEIEKAKAARKDDPLIVYRYRHGICRGREKAGSTAKDQRTGNSSRRKSEPAHWIAKIYATLNDKEQAFSWLDRGLATGALGVFYKDEPIWDPIRDDPRFGVLVGKMVVSETSK